MAERHERPMPIEAFRAKKASGKPSANAKTATKVGSTRQSTENLSSREVGIDERQEKVRLLREKQAEERKKKNDERRAAFEERKRQRELDEKMKWDALKEQAYKQESAPVKAGTGRKLPSLPMERPNTAGVARPSQLPKLNRPSTAGAQNKNTPKGPSGASSADSSPTSTPSSLTVRSSLGGAKSVSSSNLIATSAPRRASADTVGPRPQSASKTRQGPSNIPGPENKPSSSQNSLAPSSKPLSKAQSTSAIHKIGHRGSTSGIHRIGHTPSSTKKDHKAESKPKAGMMDEAAAKQALAERRRKAREEAERLALLDKKKQEEEQLRREEEERRRAEEEAKEEARMRELAELLKQQEEERLKIAMEEKEKHDKEEAERLAAELKQKEEERVAREEEEKRAREEAERKAREDEERRKQEEIERQERRKRVEQIMSRTRQRANQTASSDDTKPALQVTANTNQETKDLNPEDTKRKVSEILQKVKGLHGSQTNLTQTDHNEESVLHSEGSADVVKSDTNEEYQCGLAESDRGPEHMLTVSDNKLGKQDNTCSPASNQSIGSATVNGGHSHGNNNNQMNSSIINVLPNGNSTAEKDNSSISMGSELQESSSDSSLQIQDTVSSQDESGIMESTLSKSKPSVGMVNAAVVGTSDDVDGEATVNDVDHEVKAHNGDNNDDFTEKDEDRLWAQAELTMKTREALAIEALENSGIVAEGDEEEGSEEGQMWKAIEGKIEIAEVV